MKTKFNNWVTRNSEQLEKDFIIKMSGEYGEFCMNKFEFEMEEYGK